MSKWEKKKLIQICDFQGGSQPPKDEWLTKRADGYVRMLQIRDFTQNRNDIEEFVKISQSTKTCKSDDVLIARYGASLGKILTGREGAYNVAIMKTIPDERLIDKKYLYYFLISDIFQNFLKSISSRAAQAGFNKDDLKTIEIPLPPLETQKKIAETLDKASELIEKRKQQIEKLDLLVKAKFIDMFGDPKYNDWNNNLLNNYLIKIEAGWSVDGENRISTKKEEGILKISAVTSGRFKPFEYKVINKGVEVKKKIFPKKGDILFSRANTKELLGATCIIDREYPYLLLSDKLWQLNFDNNVNYIYIKHILSTKYFRRVISELATGTSGSMYNISMEKFKNITIPVPPLDLQNQFADFAQKVEQQKAELEKGLAQLELNYKALMQKCFSGELF